MIVVSTYQFVKVCGCQQQQRGEGRILVWRVAFTNARRLYEPIAAGSTTLTV
jgi:hypothetical protein